MLVKGALLVNGTVGVGKTSVAEAVGDELRRHGVPGAVIDLDGLRNAWPAPAGDPFQLELTLHNLAAVAANAVAAGAHRLVLAGVLESVGDRHRYADAVAMPLQVCRLRADLAVVRERLRVRHAGDPEGLAWHLHRSGELDAILAMAGVDDFVLDATRATVPDLAAEVLRRWVLPA